MPRASLEVSMGTMGGALGTLGGSLEGPWGVLGGPWRSLGRPWGAWGPPGAPWGSPWGPQAPRVPRDTSSDARGPLGNAQVTARDPSGTSQMSPGTLPDPPRGPPRPSPEITRAFLAALVEHRFKNSPAAGSHQPSASSQQPAASNQQPTPCQHPATRSQQRAAKPRRLSLQPSLHAIA